MKCKASYLLAIFMGLLIMSCEDIFEPDIAGRHVILRAPADNALVQKADVIFNWDRVEGARSYNLVIASPSFANPTQLYIDTVTVESSITFPLQPGNYEWRVRALNAGYITDYSSRSFVVDTATNLSGAQVRLKTPANNTYINQQVVEFSWEKVNQAERYLFEFTNGLSFDTVVHATSFKKRLPQEDETYSWRVTALNSTGLAMSNTNTFSTDFNAPDTPELLFPRADTTVFTWPISLKWKRKSIDVVDDTLFLYLSDQESLFPGFPVKVPSTAFTLTSGHSLVPGTYFWAVKSVDRATNTSTLSPKRRFIVR